MIRRHSVRAAARLLHSSICPFTSISPFSICASPIPNIARPHRQFSQTIKPWRDETISYAFPASGDTIYALSTAQGRAGIAVVRISGPSCLDIYKGLCPSKNIPKPRYATVRSLYEPKDGSSSSNVLDSEALVLYFPAPATVTGEDVLELHIHGGQATVKAVLSAVGKCHSQQRIRYAEPGEFTKRAFINDRLDLAQIESLSDTLAAETEQQRRAAVRGNSGALGKTYESWRQQLLYARGELEALIDFSEDQHFDESQSDLLHGVTKQIREMMHSILLHEQGSQRSELLRNGIKIALVGPPNVGKSSLMNLIVGREASIVSGEAGTTRDIVEASLDIRGYLCSFADTAGFRSQTTAAAAAGNGSGVWSGAIGPVELEGIRRAKQKAEDADIVVVLASVEAGINGPFIQYDAETLDLAAAADASLLVVNKSDAVDKSMFEQLLTPFKNTLAQRSDRVGAATVQVVSCKEAESTVLGDTDPGGIHKVIDALDGCFSEMTTMPGELQDLLGVTERQRQLLAECRQHLEQFLLEAQREEQGMEADSVLAAEFLRYAADCLARITGKGEAGDVEDVLGVIFEKFCVGK